MFFLCLRKDFSSKILKNMHIIHVKDLSINFSLLKYFSTLLHVIFIYVSKEYLEYITQRIHPLEKENIILSSSHYLRKINKQKVNVLRIRVVNF